MEPACSNITTSKSRLPNWMEDPSRTSIKIRADKKIPHDDHESDGKIEKRFGKGHQSKNLEAERKRRKKLNDRLYSLRALVPNITKLDRGAILGDAINYVMELRKQAKDLEIELEHDSNDDEDMIVRKCTDHKSMKNGCPKHEPFGNGACVDALKQNNKVGNENKTVQQMEPQVEVIQIDGNELFVKVFYEHKHGEFVRILEAINAMGFRVNNVNATRHTCLVSNIFTVEKMDSETFQTDHVRESLLELARNPLREALI